MPQKKKSKRPAAGGAKKAVSKVRKSTARAAKKTTTRVKKSAAAAGRSVKKAAKNPRRTVRKAADNVQDTASKARGVGQTVVTAGELLTETADFVDSMAQRAKQRVGQSEAGSGRRRKKRQAR